MSEKVYVITSVEGFQEVFHTTIISKDESVVRDFIRKNSIVHLDENGLATLSPQFRVRTYVVEDTENLIHITVDSWNQNGVTYGVLYSVDDDEMIGCTCPSFMYRKDVKEFCKHMGVLTLRGVQERP